MSIVAAIQMCSSNNLPENLITAEKLITEAANNGAVLAVLPEMFSIITTDQSLKLQNKETINHGVVQSFLSQQAKKNNLWLVGGTIPIFDQNSDKARAACLVYDAAGNLAGRYDKIHLFDVVLSEKESYKESDTTEAGDQVTVIDTPIGKLGLAVCYDLRFPNLFTQLFKLGAEIIAIPAAFTVKTGSAHWQLLTRSRAVENFCYVICAAQGGIHNEGRQTYGHSLIVDPWGTVIAEQTENTPGVIYGEIDLAQLYKIRASIPVHLHR